MILLNFLLTGVGHFANMRILALFLALLGLCEARPRFHTEQGVESVERRQSAKDGVYPVNLFDQLVGTQAIA